MTSVYADTSYETIERLRQHQDYREIKSSISRPLQNLVEMYSTTTIAGEKYRFNSERPSGEIEKFNGAERGWGVVFSLADFGIDCNRWFIKSIIPSPTSSRALVNLSYKRGDLKRVMEIDAKRGLMIKPWEGGFFAPPGSGGLVWVNDESFMGFDMLATSCV